MLPIWRKLFGRSTARLNRYILSECLYFFGLCLAVFTGLLFTIRILKFSSLIINKGVASSQIGMVFAAIIPTFLEFALPLATLLGVLLGCARLSGDSEIVILRASGISIYQLLRPIGIFAVLVYLLANLVSFTLKPWGHRTLSDALFEIARSTSTAGLEAGTFNRIGSITIYAEEIKGATGNLKGVMIDDRRGEEQRKIIFADRGKILSQPITRSIIFSLDEGSIHEMIGGKYLSTQFVKNSIVLGADELYDPEAKQKGTAPRELTAEQLKESIEKLHEAMLFIKRGEHLDQPTINTADSTLHPLYSPSLLDYILNPQLANSRRVVPLILNTTSSPNPPDLDISNKGAAPRKDDEFLQMQFPAELFDPIVVAHFNEPFLSYSQLKKKQKRLLVELDQRWSMPFASAILAVLALPLGIHPPRAQRMWGVGLSVGVGVGVFVLYYGLLSLGLTLVESQNLSSAIGVWLPNIVISIVSIFLIQKIGSEKWSSITDLITQTKIPVSSLTQLITGRKK